MHHGHEGKERFRQTAKAKEASSILVKEFCHVNYSVAGFVWRFITQSLITSKNLKTFILLTSTRSLHNKGVMYVCLASNVFMGKDNGSAHVLSCLAQKGTKLLNLTLCGGCESTTLLSV